MGFGVQITRVATTQTYNSQARLMNRAGGGATTSYTYDAQGNTYFETETGLPTGGNGRERAAWFGRDGRLRATDSRSSGRRIVEEYRYDALGRRVWVRQRTQCEPINDVTCASPFARRTIWDGGQELAEIQAPYDVDVATVEELDSGWPLQPYNLLAGTDPNPFYGRVVYSPGLVVDQPLSVTRFDYRDNPNGASPLTWPTFTLVPYWNYQGLASFGTFSDGTSFRPYATGGTSCPALGNTTTQRCVILQWQFAHSALDQNRGKLTWRSWQGSLLEGKRDRSGLDYRRARVYDPETGRFTQEDPIGLAGGLNLYGFAGGDPVNFGDPFGLAVCFRGSGSEVRSLRSAAQTATNSDIKLDSDNCVESVASRGNAKFNRVREYFQSLVDASEVFEVNMLGREMDSPQRNPYKIAIFEHYGGLAYPSMVNSRCVRESTGFSLSQVLAHELFHHYTVPSTGRMNSNELRAVDAENLVNSAIGRPQRCAY